MTMAMEAANETDVREEIAAPLLTLLGYERGTENDILREFTLQYDRVFLGRKKSSDPLLRGRADYILSVTGAGRWCFEIKSPTEEITPEVVDQAISYARHPRVSGCYAAVLNGRRLVVYHNSQTSDQEPFVDLEVTSAATAALRSSTLACHSRRASGRRLR
jgi:predicted type IV restriction endonuclease